MSDRVPCEYFNPAKKKCDSNKIEMSTIFDTDKLNNNLDVNSVPESIYEITYENYMGFLEKRRKLMAKKIRQYYYSL